MFKKRCSQLFVGMIRDERTVLRKEVTMLKHLANMAGWAGSQSAASPSPPALCALSCSVVCLHITCDITLFAAHAEMSVIHLRTFLCQLLGAHHATVVLQNAIFNRMLFIIHRTLLPKGRKLQYTISLFHLTFGAAETKRVLFRVLHKDNLFLTRTLKMSIELSTEAVAEDIPVSRLCH